MRPALPAIAALSCLLSAACGSSSDKPASSGPPQDGGAPPSGPVALYGPRETTRLTPFPSDRYTKSDPASRTGLRVDIGPKTTSDVLVTAYPLTAQRMNELDGFSTSGGAYANFSARIDEASVARPLEGYAAADAPMALVDVDPASPDRGKPMGLLPRVYANDVDQDIPTADYTLVAQPAWPLRPRTRYLFVLTDRVKDDKGAAVRASDDTRALLSGAAKGAYEDAVRAALPEATKATGIAADRVVLATLFTTESVHEETIAMAKDRRASPPPALVGQLAVNQQGAGADKRVRFAGRFAAPEFRRPKPDGTWEIVDGKPKAQKTAELEFFLAFANREVSGPRPVAIFGHGLGGDKDGVWGTAERLADLGAAVIGIDSPEHGSRGDPPFPNGKTDLVQATFGFFGVDSATKTFDIARARDNFRQMFSDQLELVRFVRSLDKLDVLPVGAPDGVPDLDTTKIIYLGHSFGSVQGPGVGALAPEIRAACWNVGGDGMMMLLRDSPLFGFFVVNGLKPPGTPDGDVGKFFAMTQAIVDPGDPLNYARFNAVEALPGVPDWKAKDVLVQEVVKDGIVPNSTTEGLARAAGLAHVQPVLQEIPGLPKTPAPAKANLASGATGGIFQFDKADGKTVDHGSLIFTTEGRAQYVKFFDTALSAGRATIVNPYP